MRSRLQTPPLLSGPRRALVRPHNPPPLAELGILLEAAAHELPLAADDLEASAQSELELAEIQFRRIGPGMHHPLIRLKPMIELAPPSTMAGVFAVPW